MGPGHPGSSKITYWYCPLSKSGLFTYSMNCARSARAWSTVRNRSSSTAVLLEHNIVLIYLLNRSIEFLRKAWAPLKRRWANPSSTSITSAKAEVSPFHTHTVIRHKQRSNSFVSRLNLPPILLQCQLVLVNPYNLSPTYLPHSQVILGSITHCPVCDSAAPD